MNPLDAMVDPVRSIDIFNAPVVKPRLRMQLQPKCLTDDLRHQSTIAARACAFAHPWST